MIRFTKEEKLILLFILAALFIGTSITYYKKLNPTFVQNIEFKESELGISAKININKADKRELLTIKHIGPVLAERIIAYREKHGPFEKVEDIKNVKGIGEKVYEKIKEKITFE